MEKATPPSWFNDCIDESAQIDSSVIRASQDKLKTVINRIHALAIVMTVSMFLAFSFLVFACIVWLLTIFMYSSRENLQSNSEKLHKEFRSFLKHYSLFN